MCVKSGTIMSHVLVITVFLFAIFGFTKCNAEECEANESKDWYYDNSLPNGPDHWDEKYPDCKGDSQTPIDIQKDAAKPMEDSDELQFKDYDQPLSKVTIENLGYTVKLMPNDDIERAVIVNGVTYKLKAIFFHWGNKQTAAAADDDDDDTGDADAEPTATPGSDHKIDGKQYAMEIQVEHQTDNENEDKINVAVLLDISDDSNSFIEAIQKPIDNYKYEGDKYDGDLNDDFSTSINLSDLIPADGTYFQYSGSLPLPPCTENVIWYILQNPSTVATSQILQFEDLYSVKESEASADENSGCHMVDNYRGPQPLNDRTVSSG